MRIDPYHEKKPIHKAAKMNDKGQVSALCAEKPRAISLKVATWTLRNEAVTCKKCLAKIKRLSA
jgi:hypothetical protein